MYIPKLHEQSDLRVLHALMRAHPLGTWVTQCGGELIVNHVPFFLDTSQGPYGTLRCHVARANSVWQLFSKNVPSVIVFHGPDAYVSPSWYASKQVHGKVVPTWNYTVVHAHGVPAVIEDEAQLLAHLNELTDRQERHERVPWHVGDAPAEFIARTAQHIVGLTIPITQISGKWKVSQNRSPADRAGAAAGLRMRDDAAARQMADLVDEATRQS